MNKVILEGSKFTNKEALHENLKRELKFPDYYGENLDALWDCLTTDLELPIIIEWVDFQISRKFLGDYAESTLEIFRDAEKSTEGKLKIHIK
ncbi:barstar family protein [Clostridium sp. PL3]|uniref:Barstar family protein n=1 Tax=Clostridium thailandense TaxID=2794346 RepID=A0A949TQ95_9CLOT|nr:barstar family protein [Clostridium thailandense]MBV7276555.1 barstar family protein [Clostridium thailandense]